MCLDLSDHRCKIGRLDDTFNVAVRQVNVMRSIRQMQMVRSSVPPANQVARCILPMVTVFVEEQYVLWIDRHVFEYFE
jgi:hypothetical protein